LNEQPTTKEQKQILMKNDFQNQKKWSFDQMMAYLKGELAEEERVAFEQDMEADEALASDLEDLHDEWLMNPELEEEVKSFRQSFLGKMETIAVSEKKEKTGPSIVRWLLPYAAVAASIALMTWFFLLNSQGSCAIQDAQCLLLSEGLYQNRAISKGENIDEQLNTAVVAYETKDFATAIPLLEQLETQDLNLAISTEIKFCLVNAYIFEDNLAKAQNVLSSLSRSLEPRLVIEQQWLSLLVALGNADLGKAKALAQSLSNSNNKYKTSAEYILKQL
jgi:hypothetical protein